MAVLLAIILTVVFTSPLLRLNASRERVEIGFTGLDGRTYTTAAQPFKGRIVVVDLMAANCPPCNAEMPELIAFQDSIRGMDVDIISLSIWVDQPGFGETRQDLADFQDRWDADWTFGVPENTLDLVVKYNIQFPPFKLILDREGTLVETLQGETTASDLLQAIGRVP